MTRDPPIRRMRLRRRTVIAMLAAIFGRRLVGAAAPDGIVEIRGWILRRSDLA